MKRLPMLAVWCAVAVAASGCKKAGSAGADEPQQPGLLREVEEQAAEDLACGGGDEDDEGDEEGEDEGDEEEDEDEDEEEADEDEGGEGGVTVRWVDGGYLAEGCGRQVRYEVDCVGEPGEEVCSISLEDSNDDEDDEDDDEGEDDDGEDDEEDVRRDRDGARGDDDAGDDDGGDEGDDEDDGDDDGD